MMSNVKIFAVLALSAVVVTASLTAQSAAPPSPSQTFRSAIELVQVDVIAVDKDGNHVRGLTAADFTVIDRGKPQSISTFSEFGHERVATAPAPPKPIPVFATVKRDVASNQTAQSERLIVMVIDDLHIYKGRTDRVKDIARKVVNDLGPQSSMAVLLTSGERSMEVTEDPTELNRAIDEFKGRRPFPRPILGSDTSPGAGTIATSGGGQDFYDNMSAMKTLQDAARMLGTPTSRRKAFIFVSEWFALDLTGLFGAMAPLPDLPTGGDVYAATGLPPTAPPTTSHHTFALLDMMNAMRRSNVATYAIDPRGEVTSKDLMRECHPVAGADDPCLGSMTGGAPPDWTSWVRQSQHGLEMTSAASGGFAIVNTDDFTGGLNRIVDDLDAYYLLGFYPQEPDKKGYRQLEVKVNRPGVTLRYRRGYDPAGAPAPPVNKDPLVALAAAVMPMTDVKLRLTASPLPSATAETRVAMSLEVTEPRKGLVKGGEAPSDALKYGVIAVNMKTGKIVKQFTNTAQVSSQPLTDAPGAKTGPPPDLIVFQVPAELMLPAGRYQLRASVNSTKLGTGGSVYLTLDVPDFSRGLAVSPLIIGYADGPRVTISTGELGKPGAKAQATTSFTPTLDRTFTATDTLRVYFDLINRNPTMPVRVLIEVVDAAGQTAKSFSPQFERGNRGIEFKLNLQGLTAGDYVLRGTVSSAGQNLRRETVFAIK